MPPSTFMGGDASSVGSRMTTGSAVLGAALPRVAGELPALGPGHARPARLRVQRDRVVAAVGVGPDGRDTRRVTDHPIGVMHGVVTPDGERVVWFHDDSGDEWGHWVWLPFDASDAREPAPLAPDLPEGWEAGLTLGDDLVVVGTARTTSDGTTSDRTARYAVHVIRGAGPAQLVYEHHEDVTVDGLSRDGTAACASPTASTATASIAPCRVLDPRTASGAG